MKLINKDCIFDSLCKNMNIFSLKYFMFLNKNNKLCIVHKYILGSIY